MATLSAEEQAMMRDLMAGLDDAFSDYTPSPVKPATKPPATHRTPLTTSNKKKTSNTSKATRSPLSPILNRRQGQPKPKPSPSPLRPKKTPGRENVKQDATATTGMSKMELDALTDGIDDWDWDDMEEEATQATSSKFQSKKIRRLPERVTYSSASSSYLSQEDDAPPYIPESCTRCIVMSVEDVDLGNYRREKHLVVRVEAGPRTMDGPTMLVVLKDDWILTNVMPSDIVNILGHFTGPSLPPHKSSIVLSALENMIILHPDLLITSTSISSTSQCGRKPLISSLLQSPFNVTEASTWGSMLHEVMQECLGEGRWEKAFVEEQIDAVVRAGIPELLRIDAGVEKAKEEVRTRAVGMKAFSEKFIGNEPRADALLTDARASSSSKATLALVGLHDIEEDMWSPTYGLKGKVDASVQAIIKETDGKKSWTMPFEIKTGRTAGGMEHRAQTMLYTLLMAERYLTDVPAGLLYYTQSDQLIRVKPSRHEIRGLIVARNDTASYMVRRQAHVPVSEDDAVTSSQPPPPASLAAEFLPPTIDQDFACRKCFAVDGCMLYRKAVEGVVDDKSDIADLYDLKTSHLTPQRAEFFKNWEHLLSLEEQDMVRFRKELWTMTAKAREKSGRCFGDMVVLSYEEQTDPGVAKAYRHAYQFVRASVTATQPTSSPDRASSLLNGHITQNDAVTISIEPNLLALARGFVTQLTPTHITVAFDKPLNVDGVAARSRSSSTSSPVYRIDKDEMTGGMSRIRHNLASLFFAGGDTKRLELVVDLRWPEFEEVAVPPPCMAMLNSSQQAAMMRVLQAKDYALILGMPGTGKTTTIAEIIKELVRRGKTVLLTSYTHSAVDTILLKLLDADLNVLRLGNPDKVHPDVRKFTLGNKAVPSTLEQLEHQIFQPPVVATTCLSVDHPLFSRRTFDYCIVDEASQITLPTCLGPLRFADKFVLVGDHFQLPPLVRSRSARKGGLDVSLFRRLSEAYPHAVTDLVYQYRMNADIMLLSNKLIYNNRLQCGSDAVANQSLVIPDRESSLMAIHASASGSKCATKGCWLDQLLDESCKAVFVDTDNVPGRDSRVGDLVHNEVEAHLVHQIAATLLDSGILPSQIGVISPYRQQIKLLSHLFQQTPAQREIEILTADRSQGRDKDCIIMSMVRSNEAGQVGDLLKDWRRMNVSLTRARAKLIVIGSRKTLESVPLLNDFFGLVQEKGWIMKLPTGADKMHALGNPNAARGDKRALEEEDAESTADSAEPVITPRKKAKTDEGILKGRFILRDLVNAS